MKIIDIATGLNFEDVRAANEVADQEDFSSLVVKFSLDGILVVDTKGCYTVWNPTMEKISGMKKEQVLGRNWLEVFPFFRGSSLEESFKESLKGKSLELPPHPYEVPETKAQGFTQQRNTPIFNEKNEVIRVLCVVRDVTESMKELDRLREENRQLRERVKRKPVDF